jgi:hypothetical protein
MGLSSSWIECLSKSNFYDFPDLMSPTRIPAGTQELTVPQALDAF